MDGVDIAWSDLHWKSPDGGVESAIPCPEAEDFGHAVAVVEPEKQRPQHVVETGTRPAASGNACHGFLGVEEQFFPRAGQFEKQPGIGSGGDPFGDADGIADLVADGGGKMGFSETGRLYDKG